jgi:ribose 5-phosphate isomerase B
VRISIGSDHRGVDAKSHLVEVLTAEGHVVKDVGPNDDQRVDYPDFAAMVGQSVTEGRAERGILICGSGIGMSISANKIPGVRAALCYEESTARLSRQHNDANVLCLSGDLVDPTKNESIATVWLATEFEGGRHSHRVAKIGQLECTRVRP